MRSRDVVIEGEAGLHARPAALFCRAASRFGSDVRVEKGGASANAKSLLSVLQLDVRQGDTVTLVADGPDADEAVQALVELLVAP
jgi:phosphotransferase system HPr (HPr) family protein